VVWLGVGQRETGQYAAVQQTPVDGAGVRNVDGELVEIGAGMDSWRARAGQRVLQLHGSGGAERSDVCQSLRTHRREVDARRQSEQRLVRGDRAGRLLATDVLLAGAQ